MRVLSGFCFLLTMLACGWIGVGVLHHLMTSPPSMTLIGDTYIIPTPGLSGRLSPSDIGNIKVIPGKIVVSPPDPFPLELFLYTGIPTAIGSFMLFLLFFALDEAERRHRELLAAQYGWSKQNPPSIQRSRYDNFPDEKY